MGEVQFDIRAIALILQKRNGMPRLLAQSFVADPSIAWRFPGGSIKNSETVEEGLLREILEESRIGNLSLIRKLGVEQYYKPYPRRFFGRHDYLFEALQELPDTWEQIVCGAVSDAGSTFQFQWIGPDKIYRIDFELQKFLDYQHLPEFFT